MASVFVQIASYHDFELGKTIADISVKASGEHEIFFGVHHCFYKEREIHIPSVPNLKIIESQAPDNIGVGIARGLANSFYDGQDYYLQVDSHTRIYPNWDRSLINLVNRYLDEGISRPLLTAYPGSYSYDDNLREYNEYTADVTAISFAQKPAMFATQLIPSQLAITPDQGDIQRSVSAGFIFSTGDFADVGFNEKIMFWGEEILLAASAYTNGFELRIPDRQYAYHLYFEHDAVFQKNMRRHIWNDFPDEYASKDAISKAEVVDIFTTRRIGRGALGYLRTLEEYGQYSGLDFDTRKIIAQEEHDE
jgi:hypothetical protein